MASNSSGAVNTLQSSNPSSGTRESRESWKKKKELEEARKAGTAPAEVDEEGRDINPHIPQYISQAPWYVDTGCPTLKHQRPQEEKQKTYNAISDWYKRGETATAARKFRKGACENCGAMSHSKKDCLDRPRKLGAKFTNKDIKPDEAMQPQLSLSYDGKRDRWNGYNPDWHQEVIEEHQKIEDAKRQLKAEKLEQDLLTGDLGEGKQAAGAGGGADSDSDEDEDKYADHFDMPGTRFDNKTRSTVRNLRIREDTAKYLRNLGPDAPYYDPKTHSMRENPYSHTNKPLNELPFAGDNFVRHSGDVKGLAKQQMFAWEASEHGTDIHPNVDPTKLEMMYQEFRSKKKDFKGDQQQGILEKYGGEEHLNVPPKEMLLAQTEHYVEYSRSGAVIKGQERAKVKSRFEEDIFISNHTSVWGSFWVRGIWGYSCCHSTIKNAFCTGEAGKRAAKAGSLISPGRGRSTGEEREGEGEEEEDDKASASMVEQHKKKLAGMSKEERKRYKKTLAKDSEEGLDADKVQKAMKTLAKREEEAERMLAIDERKRPYNSMKADSSQMPTEEEMEAFKLKRRREDDPMASFLK